MTPGMFSDGSLESLENLNFDAKLTFSLRLLRIKFLESMKILNIV